MAAEQQITQIETATELEAREAKQMMEVMSNLHDAKTEGASGLVRFIMTRWQNASMQRWLKAFRRGYYTRKWYATEEASVSASQEQAIQQAERFQVLRGKR